MGYGSAGTLALLREGTNVMLCLTDDPTREDWHVACYHRDLEPFMARGRELRGEGKTRAEVDQVRSAEIESGALALPKEPRALYSLTGPPDSFDPETGSVRKASQLYVIYLPYATESGTGISAQASRERPWLMFPGTPWAHLMIPGGITGGE